MIQPYEIAETELVCPECGGGRIGTVERAYIWQPASFRIDEDGVVEDAHGNAIDIEWDAYDSEDVGDTETVGYFCRDCLQEWHDGDGERGPVPFVARSDFHFKTKKAK